jgi:hypothetical protein
VSSVDVAAAADVPAQEVEVPHLTETSITIL